MTLFIDLSTASLSRRLQRLVCCAVYNECCQYSLHWCLQSAVFWWICFVITLFER